MTFLQSRMTNERDRSMTRIDPSVNSVSSKREQRPPTPPLLTDMYRHRPITPNRAPIGICRRNCLRSLHARFGAFQFQPFLQVRLLLLLSLILSLFAPCNILIVGNIIPRTKSLCSETPALTVPQLWQTRGRSVVSGIFPLLLQISSGTRTRGLGKPGRQRRPDGFGDASGGAADRRSDFPLPFLRDEVQD